MDQVAVIAVLCAVVPLFRPSTQTDERSSHASDVPFLDGMGAHARSTTTESERARRYFDQGLILTYGFDQGAAVASFEEAARLDPDFALAWWGVALALGPNINVPMDAERAARAHAAVNRALELVDGTSPVERGLIEALARRYEDPPTEDRTTLDRAYADAMREVWRRHPGDPDVGALFAESLMILSPWDYWADGLPKPGTKEIETVLESVLRAHPEHPGAIHYYIHVVEGSPTPGRAAEAADRLPGTAPGVAHLNHMPGHIYIHVGRYGDAIEANQRAIPISRERNSIPGLPPDEFDVAHDLHFLSYAAMFAGQKELAVGSAREIAAALGEDTLARPELAEEVLPAEMHVLVRFGMWDEILAATAPEERHPYTRALWRYARGVAAANTRRTELARKELRAFEQEAARVPDGFRIFVVPAHDVLEVARRMLAGELAYRTGAVDEAFAALRSAVAAEDALRYSEPAPWMQPVRHALGALLLQEGRVEEAEAVYREDLDRNPENGWSLHGLAECLGRRGAPEAEEVARRFERAWAGADVVIRGSCYCRDVR